MKFILMSLLEILSSDQLCAEFFRYIRWPNGIYCPICGSRNIKGHGKYMDFLKRYLCKDCKSTFNDKTGTIFEHSKLKLKEWFCIAWLYFCLELPCLKVSKETKRSYSTVLKAVRKFSNLLGEEATLNGEVESDELYERAGFKGRKVLHRLPRKRGFGRRGRGRFEDDKVPIFILVQRGIEDRYTAAKDVSSETILKIFERAVEPESKVYTDEFASYNCISNKYQRESVNHSKGEWVKEEVHTNNCENRASLLRPWLALKRGISKFYIENYLQAFEFIRNSSGLSSVEKLELLINRSICPQLS